WSPDGQYLASGSVDAIARIWEVATGDLVSELRGHRTGVTSVAWSPDGRTIASSGDSFDGTVQLWETQTWTRVRTLLHSPGGGVRGEEGAGGRGAGRGSIWPRRGGG